MIKVKFLLHATFRSNPAFELIEQGNLPPQALHALAEVSRDPEFFGVFRRKDAGAADGAKLAYKEVALLFYALQQAGTLPHYFRSGYDDDVNQTMVRLVLEGIFEIQDGPRFCSGAAAQHLLYESQEREGARQHPLLAMSSGAIRYAIQLHEADSAALAAKLYAYNTVPLFFAQPNAWETSEQVEAFLRIGPADRLHRELLNHWNRHAPDRQFRWISWSRKLNKPHDTRLNATYKMYISPVPEELPDVFAKAVTVLTGSEAFSFKVGMNREGLLRPDKFVAYFAGYEQLTAAAVRLSAALTGHRAQGVPFTAPLDDTGLISWGIDSATAGLPAGSEGASWRARVTEKLAASIALSKTGHPLGEDESVDFVWKKMMLEGVDPATWTAV